MVGAFAQPLTLTPYLTGFAVAYADWVTYNRLKHAVAFEQDDWWFQDLAESARLLRTAALLNQLTGSKIGASPRVHCA